MTDGKQTSSPFTFFLVMLLILFLIMDPGIRTLLALGAGAIFEPIIGFDGNFPLLTLLFSGLIVTLITVILRHLTTDYLDVAETQHYTKHISKMLREAFKEGDKEKMNKIREKQMEFAQRSMKQSTSQMRVTMITMVIVVGIFAWLWYFLTAEVNYPYIAVPWSNFVDLRGVNILPNWILIYSSFTIPLSLVIGAVLRYLKLKKVLENEDSGEWSAG